MSGGKKQNILLRMAFCGAAYHGFQVQANAVTICETLQNAMEKTLGQRPDVKGCSRTDAGVHARDFCLSFLSDTQIPMAKLPLALNQNLPGDIRVFAARYVPEEFHARYSVAEKEYEYVVLNAAIDDAFTPHLYYRLPGALDEAAMHGAGQQLVGRHNFAAFMAAGSDVIDPTRTVTRLSVQREGDYVRLRVAADGFLYHMVRIIVGTLLAVGQGRRSAQSVAEALQSQNRQNAGDTLPARGLFLHRVSYPPQSLLLP